MSDIDVVIGMENLTYCRSCVYIEEGCGGLCGAGLLKCCDCCDSRRLCDDWCEKSSSMFLHISESSTSVVVVVGCIMMLAGGAGMLICVRGGGGGGGFRQWCW
jgi:hypothetical protein